MPSKREEVMIDTPIGLLKWSVVREALVRLEHKQRMYEAEMDKRYTSWVKRIDTLAKKKAERGLCKNKSKSETSMT